jgi:hypothetical protein
MILNKDKKIRAVLILPAAAMIIYGAYLNFEPAMVVGAGTMSDSITVTQDVTSEITISSPTDVTMSPSIAGIAGGTGNGSAVWNIRTNDTSGFNLKIKAGASPALQSGSYSFADYTENNIGTPDFSWSIAAADSEFGYTVESTTTVIPLRLLRMMAVFAAEAGRQMPLMRAGTGFRLLILLS